MIVFKSNRWLHEIGKTREDCYRDSVGGFENAAEEMEFVLEAVREGANAIGKIVSGHLPPPLTSKSFEICGSGGTCFDVLKPVSRVLDHTG
jgi:hypothetical protein